MASKRTILLWTLQGLLAALFLFAGVMKLITPAETLAQQAHMSGSFLKFIGVVEVLGALGLVLPNLLHIQEGLAPLAAAGLVILMIGATVVTLKQGGGASALIPAITGLLCAFVAYSRWRGPNASAV